MRFIQSHMQDWYKKQLSEYLKTDDRPHGAKLGDRVKLHSEFGWTDEFWEEYKNEECYCELEIAEGAIGHITQLTGLYSALVEFPCEITVHAQDGIETYEDEYEIELDIVFEDYDRYYACFELLSKKKTKPSNQLILF